MRWLLLAILCILLVACNSNPVDSITLENNSDSEIVIQRCGKDSFRFWQDECDQTYNPKVLQPDAQLETIIAQNRVPNWWKVLTKEGKELGCLRVANDPDKDNLVFPVFPLRQCPS